MNSCEEVKKAGLAFAEALEKGLEEGKGQTMTREEALKLLADARYADDLQGNNDLQAAHIMAMKALEQEPKNGHWIAEKIYPPLSDAQRTVYRCSCCDLHFDCVSNYCPTCGAKMEMRIRNEGTMEEKE